MYKKKLKHALPNTIISVKSLVLKVDSSFDIHGTYTD